MKNIILAAVAAFAFIAPSFAAEGTVAAVKLNETCVCGKPADAKVEAVNVKVGEVEHKVATCSKDCAEAVKKMKAEDAWKAVEAHNQAPAVTK